MKNSPINPIILTALLCTFLVQLNANNTPTPIIPIDRVVELSKLEINLIEKEDEENSPFDLNPYFRLPQSEMTPIEYRSMVLPMHSPSAEDLFGPSAASYRDAGVNMLALGSQFAIPELEMDVRDLVVTETISMMMNDEPDPLAAQMVNIAKGNATQNAKKAKKIVEDALLVGKYIDQLTGGDLVTMPLIKEQVMGNTTVQIIFNSATIYPQYAEIEVYIRIQLPRKDFKNQDVELFFGAEDIKFSKDKGIISGVVGLLSDYAFKLDDSDKAAVYLKGMDNYNNAGDGSNPADAEYVGTYVSFDCDGFREMGLGGSVLLSRDWVKPTDEFGVPLTVPNNEVTPTPRVNAEINVIIQDLNDMMVGIDISDPFVLTKWDKMSFELSNVWIDMSQYRNPPNIPYEIEENIWEGVYIEKVGVTLPEPFKRTCGETADNTSSTDPPEPPEGEEIEQENPDYEEPPRCRIAVEGHHLLIDHTGVTGSFNIDGQVPLVGGAVMGGEWGYSLESIGIVVSSSQLQVFSFSGQLGVPLLSKSTPLDYFASINPDDDTYMFDLTLPTGDKPIQAPLWNVANMEIETPTLSATVSQGEFDATISFASATLQMGNPNDVKDDPDGSLIKLPGLTLTGVDMNTQAPFIQIENIAIISPPGSQISVGNFPVTLGGLEYGVNPANEKEYKFGFTINLNLMNNSDNAINASGKIDMYGDYTRDIDGTRSWKYNRTSFNGATVLIDLPEFYAIGRLDILRGDPIYGNGFSASLNAGILNDGGPGTSMSSPEDGRYSLDMTAIFGKVPGEGGDAYRYFMVDGFLGGLGVPLFGNIELDGFGGGVFRHMQPSAYVGDNAEVSGVGVSTSGIQYKPTQETSFGIKFSTSIVSTEGTLDGLLTCIVQFDGMSLRSIKFWGTADLALPEIPAVEKLSSKLDESISKVADKLSIIKEKAAEDTETVLTGGSSPGSTESPSGIRANVGLSLDFDNNTFHAVAKVLLNVNNGMLQGEGNLDLLIAPSQNKWHFYLGGYYKNDQNIVVEVPDFFDPTNTVTLGPVTAGLDYGSFNVKASMYFLTGNDIPGPPPAAPEVVDFFGELALSDNRDQLTCGGADPANGTGFAFGASAFFNLQAVSKGLFGSCVLGLKVKATGGVGFDLALLKYGSNTVCPMSGTTPQGLNGLRASGRVFAFIELEGGHFTCIPIPPLGFGMIVLFDVPNPSHFRIAGVVKVGDGHEFDLEIGQPCGSPCANDLDFEN